MTSLKSPVIKSLNNNLIQTAVTTKLRANQLNVFRVLSIATNYTYAKTHKNTQKKSFLIVPLSSLATSSETGCFVTICILASRLSIPATCGDLISITVFVNDNTQFSFA